MSEAQKKELITIREFARRIKMSYSVAYRAVKKGRVSTQMVENEKRIVWPDAKKEFEANRDVSKVRKKDAEKLGIDILYPDFGSNGRNGNGGGGGETIDIWDAKARKENFIAKIRELDYLERSGELVSAKAVEDTAFRKAREIRDAFLNIPDRIASLLANETDATRCHAIITQEIETVLNKLAKNEPD
jgi:hypothetical protein